MFSTSCATRPIAGRLVFAFSAAALVVASWPYSRADAEPASTIPPQAQAASPGEATPALTRIWTRIPRLPMDFYTSVAHEVVVGTVVGSRPVFPAEGLAHTEVYLEVQGILKGSPPPVLRLAVAGAEREGETVICDKAPRLAVGDAILVFLERAEGDDTRFILGLSDGTYRIGASESGEVVVAGLHALPGEGLEAFAVRVRDSVARGGK